MADLTGKSIAGYTIEKPLGTGSHGAVYQIQADGKPAAIKFLNEKLRQDAALGKSVQGGWEKAKAVAHPNLVKVTTTGNDGQYGPYCVQEFLKVKSLRKIVTDGMKMNWRDGLEICTQIVTGLKALHDAGQTHGGFWPGSVLLTLDMDVKLVSAGGMAGVARPLGEILEAPAPAYYAPERIQGSASTPSSDLYCAGMSLYYLFAATEPFPGQDPQVLARYVVEKKPPALLSFREDLPQPVLEFLERLIAKDPTKRYCKADDVLKDLALLKNGKPMNPLQGGQAAMLPMANVATPSITQAQVSQAMQQLENPNRTPSRGPRSSGNKLAAISGRLGQSGASNIFGKLQTHVGSTISKSPKEKEGDDYYRGSNLGAALGSWKEARDAGNDHPGLRVKIELGEMEFKEVQAEAALGESRLCLDNNDFTNALKHAAEARKSSSDSIRLEAGKLEEKAFALEKQLIQKKKMTIIIAAAVGVVVLIGVIVMFFMGKK